jgi:hypothetical protein
MKTWWLAALALAGCASEDKPDIDASGTVSTQMTYGGGNCQKSGNEAFTIYLARNAAYNSYDITQPSPDATVGGDVVCGPVYCQIMIFKQWTDVDYVSYDIQATLTLDGNTNAITGNGTYKAFGSAINCEQQVTFAGSLQ